MRPPFTYRSFRREEAKRVAKAAGKKLRDIWQDYTIFPKKKGTK
mgnify:CR=1 FL=1